MVEGHGSAKYKTGRLLESSVGRRWPSLLAERWAHDAGSLPQFTPCNTEISILLKGQCRVERAGGGIRQDTRGSQGTTWLSPSGICEEYVYLHTSIDEMLHIYLPSEPFTNILVEDFDLDARNVEIRYHATDYDLFIDLVARQVLFEMEFPTSSGALLIEALSTALSAHLLHQYSVNTIGVTQNMPNSALDRNRLSRVIDYVETNISGNLSVADMARVACLSPAHFARSFRATTGKTPHEFVSGRRLTLAKRMLLDGASLSDIAFAAGFSSQANFARAFRRAMRMTAGEFRLKNVS